MGDIFDELDDIFKDKPEKPKDEIKPNAKAYSHRMSRRAIPRKLASEAAAENMLPWHFENGMMYHCFSFGDVDSLTYLKIVARQQKLKFVLLSTWCMSGDDIQTLEQWHDRGIMERCDMYVGEIFKGSYPEAYEEAQKAIAKWNGRLVTFRNHSKIMAVKGERFDVLIESSANVNTNPRSENTVLTVDSDLVDWYINLFADITPFNKDYGAEPFRTGDIKK